MSADGLVHQAIGVNSYAHGQSRMGIAAGRCTIGIQLLTRCPDLELGFAADGFLDDYGAYGNSKSALVYFDCSGGGLWAVGRRRFLSANQDAGTANTCLWLQLDVDTGEVRLRVNEDDYGVIHTLAPGFALPVHPMFNFLRPGEAFELLSV
jgi:hypothetical protein